MNQSIARIKRESFSTTQVEGQAGKLNETAKLPYGAAFLKPAIDDNQLFLTGTGQREDDEEKKAGYAKRTVLKNQGGLASLLLLMGSDAFFFSIYLLHRHKAFSSYSEVPALANVGTNITCP